MRERKGTLGDLAAFGWTVRIECLGRCRTVEMRGPILLGRFGLERTPFEVQRLARCKRCGAPGAWSVEFEDEWLWKEKHRRGL